MLPLLQVAQCLHTYLAALREITLQASALFLHGYCVCMRVLSNGQSSLALILT